MFYIVMSLMKSLKNSGQLKIKVSCVSESVFPAGESIHLAVDFGVCKDMKNPRKYNLGLRCFTDIKTD